MLQAALLGGIAIGVLSALPVVNVANCCCAWILFGGGLSAYLLQQGRPVPISAGDGALAGLLAGAIGAVIWSLLSIPINAAFSPFQAAILERTLEGARDMPPEVRAWIEGLRGRPAIGAAWVVGMFLMAGVASFFGMLGGLFGALVVRKSGPPPAPPPMPPQAA